MSDQTSIFNENTLETPTQTTPDSNTDINTLLSEIKNEKGEPKYKSTTEAIKALKHSQNYIPELSKELKEYKEETERLRKEAERVTELEEIIKRLNPSDKSDTVTTVQEYPEDKISSKIDEILAKRETKEIQTKNIDTVVNTLRERLGENAESQFYTKAKELGMSVVEMNTLASKAPLAVLQLFGVTESVKNKTSVSTSSVNTTSFEPTTTSSITKNSKSVLMGATSSEILEESRNAAKLVQELHSQNRSVHELTDPKVFFKTFK